MHESTLFAGYLNVQYNFEDVVHQNTFMGKIVREKKRGKKKEEEKKRKLRFWW